MTEFSAGYTAFVDRLVVLIEQWCLLEPGLPDLRWHARTDGIVITGALEGQTLDFLAASPDARRLLEWLDEQTGHQASLLQAECALGILGHLPMPKHVTLKRPLTTTSVPKATCPDCDRPVECATNAWGQRPEPMDLVLCIGCGAFLRFGDDLVIRKLSAEEFSELHEDNQAELRAMKRRHDQFTLQRRALKSSGKA